MNPSTSVVPLSPAADSAPICTNVFSRWGEAMSRRVLTLQAQNMQPSERFSGHAAIARFHRCVAADIRSSAHRVMRTRSLVSADQDRYFKVMWQVSGRNRIEHRRNGITIEPGQWAIYDTAQPYTVETSDDSRFLVLLLPMSEMSRWGESGLDYVAGKVLPTRGTSEIARSALTAMLTGGMELEGQGAVVMQDSISALLGTAIAQVYGQTPQQDGAARRRLQKVQQYIDDRLTDPGLSPEAVAQACGMSRRSLYTAFNAIGQTPNHYILQKRLAVAARRLGDLKQQVTITQLAFEMGFSDAAHFSRLFSERYGQSPSSWRNQQLAER